MGKLLELAAGLWGKVAAILLAIVAVLAAIAKIKHDGAKQGRAEERAKTQAAQTKAIQDRRLSDEVVDGLSDDDVRQRLRERWTRHD